MQSSLVSEKSQVIVFVDKLKNPTHIFEYTEEELEQFFEQNKNKELMIMKAPANVTDVDDGQTIVQSSLDDAVNSTIMPTLTMSTEFSGQPIVDETELKRSEKRIERLEKQLAERNKQYAELHNMYMTLQNRLANVLGELQKQRYLLT